MPFSFSTASLGVKLSLITLRAIRGFIGLVATIYFIGAYQALRVTFVHGSTSPDDILILVVKSFACLICFGVFSALRKLIHHLHIRKYGYPHPTLRSGWSLRL